MERHHYHVMSNAVIDALELIIDSDNNASSSNNTLSYASALSNTSASNTIQQNYNTPKQYAMISQHIHRLEYLNNEREYLKKMKSSNCNNSEYFKSLYHRIDRPHPEPAEQSE